MFAPARRLPELPGGDPRRSSARLRARDLKLMAFHPLGTARARRATRRRRRRRRPAASTASENVYVADGSAVPSALGVNPQMTIMALATRLGVHLQRSAMSFLIDPPWLYANGRIAAALAPSARRRRVAAAATLAVFWA